MTAIAFDGKVMAADSLCTTADGFKLTSTPKIFKLKGGGILGTAGDDDIREVMALLDNCKDEYDLPSRRDLGATQTDFNGLLYLPNKRLYYIIAVPPDKEAGTGWDGSVTEITAPYWAVGHGGDIALGAMAAGADAIDAIKAACHHSRFCELPVQVMNIDGFRPKRKPNLKMNRKVKRIEPDPVDEVVTMPDTGRKFKVTEVEGD
jgi:hypothetical protein